MDIYYVTSQVARVALPEDIAFVATHGLEYTIPEPDNPRPTKIKQLLCVADNEATASLLFHEFFNVNNPSLKIGNIAFGGTEFEGLHQDMLNETT